MKKVGGENLKPYQPSLGMTERLLIRIVVSGCLCAALLACALVPIPRDLPSPAFEQAALYRLETALMVFYGALLLITPTFSALVRGRLPVEISTRGAKFAEEADQAAERNEATLKELQRSLKNLSDELTEADIEIARLKEGDST